GQFFSEAFVDNGCLCRSAFSSHFVHSRKLPRIPIKPRALALAKDDVRDHISFITFVDMDLDGRKERVWGYVIRNLGFDIILGKPWLEQNQVKILSEKRALRFG